MTTGFLWQAGAGDGLSGSLEGAMSRAGAAMRGKDVSYLTARIEQATQELNDDLEIDWVPGGREWSGRIGPAGVTWVERPPEAR